MEFNRRQRLADLRARKFGREPDAMEEYEKGDGWSDSSGDDRDGWVDSSEEIDDIRYNKPVVSLSDSSLSSQGIAPEEDEKTKAGKLFGFIRGRVDEATDEFKMKREARQEAYKDYLEQKPSMLKAKYKSEYEEKLKRSLLPTEDKWQNLFSGMSGGMQKLGNLLGGSKSPEQVMGFSGTVFGPMPGAGTYGAPQGSNYQSNIAQALGRMPQQQPSMVPPPSIPPHTQTQGQQVPDPRLEPGYMKPGATGAQVPKYQSWPKNAKPGTTYVRVQDIDQWGKKRSFMRKTRVPQSVMPEVPGQVPSMPSMGQGPSMPMQGMPMGQPKLPVSADVDQQAMMALLEGTGKKEFSVPQEGLGNGQDFARKVGAFIPQTQGGGGDPDIIAHKTDVLLGKNDQRIAQYFR